MLIVEPQVPGLKIDGAAFIVDGRPVIGMTLRTDTVDNFWFTLMHELAHVTLHFSTGLAVGFYDQTDQETSVDEQEEEERDTGCWGSGVSPQLAKSDALGLYASQLSESAFR